MLILGWCITHGKNTVLPNSVPYDNWALCKKQFVHFVRQHNHSSFLVVSPIPDVYCSCSLRDVEDTTILQLLLLFSSNANTMGSTTVTEDELDLLVVVVVVLFVALLVKVWFGLVLVVLPLLLIIHKYFETILERGSTSQWIDSRAYLSSMVLLPFVTVYVGIVPVVTEQIDWWSEWSPCLDHYIYCPPFLSLLFCDCCTPLLLLLLRTEWWYSFYLRRLLILSMLLQYHHTPFSLW